MLTSRLIDGLRFANLSFASHRLMSSTFISPFQENEVYCSHHDDYSMRNGPVLMHDNTASHLIIGGGVMGQSLAYNLWRQIEKASPLKAYKSSDTTGIVIVEKDPTLHESSTALSVGGIRTQFSRTENVKMSLGSAEFLRKIKKNLSTVKYPDPDVQLNHQGYLMMATEKGAELLMNNYNLQIAAGAKVMLMTKERLKETFPWMNVDGIELAAYGLENEGWFDPMSLVNAFQGKNSSFPITNITGEVVGFRKEVFDTPLQLQNSDRLLVDLEEKLDGVYIKTKEYDKPVFIRCLKMYNCAGPMSGHVANLAGIGNDANKDHHILQHKLPVERRKRYVYVVHCPDAPVLDMPFIVDPSGFYIRREGFGGKYVCGMSPTEDQEPSTDNLDVDYDFFDNEIWPRLAERIPVFEKLKVVSAWSGYYDYNTFDQNAIIGPHPYYFNLYFLTGFSGHGIQQSCKAGENLAALVANNMNLEEYEEMKAFSFSRIIEKRPMIERNII